MQKKIEFLKRKDGKLVVLDGGLYDSRFDNGDAVRRGKKIGADYIRIDDNYMFSMESCDSMRTGKKK